MSKQNKKRKYEDKENKALHLYEICLMGIKNSKAHEHICKLIEHDKKELAIELSQKYLDDEDMKNEND